MSIIRIASDPTSWALDDDVPIQTIKQDLMTCTDPLALDVIAPLKGRLLLSTRSASSAAVLTPPTGWIPGGLIEPYPLLYLPTAAGPIAASHGYALSRSLDLAALESDILSAMTQGTTTAVGVIDGIFGGSLVLNGSTLPFAVLCPSGTPSGTSGS